MKFTNYEVTNLILGSQIYYLYSTNNDFIYINFIILIFYNFIYTLIIFKYFSYFNRIINFILIDKIKSVNKYDNYIELLNKNNFKKSKSILDTNQLSEYILSLENLFKSK